MRIAGAENRTMPGGTSIAFCTQNRMWLSRAGVWVLPLRAQRFSPVGVLACLFKMKFRAHESTFAIGRR